MISFSVVSMFEVEYFSLTLSIIASRSVHFWQSSAEPSKIPIEQGSSLLAIRRNIIN